jgi:hypothetical protein
MSNAILSAGERHFRSARHKAWHPIGIFGDLSDEDIVVRIPL